ncbi:putative metalloreductase [Talaromyces proteolyticus]|uniref:Metalloreductase n=1 Tax=Talaromyces proteolyticus TaxID=1131652 RepID=A0AAD4PZQ0_9EURO|nr:putative metalloreductase [Talaromyces proteolyticus]KAH8696592.1 putative metalloreductase [Talaromyces proteolyticus]
MSSSSGLQAHARAHTYATNYTYIYEYSRGLNGVDVPRDILITRTICGSLGFVAFIVLVSRMWERVHAYIRHISCLSGTRRQQLFWSFEGYSVWPAIKKYVIHSPLFWKRHHREFQLSSAMNMGVLPTRIHTILLVLYAASQLAYCAILDYAVNERAALVAELRGRSGTLAVLNMIPLVLFAGRNNLLIWLLGISYDTYNMFHRCLGRMVVLETIVHTTSWFVNASNEQSFTDAIDRIRTTPFFAHGALGTVAMLFIFIQSPSPIRHAFYETFLHLHQFAALLATIGVYYHMHLDALPQLPWIYLVIGIWIFERSMRWLLRFRMNISLRNGRTMVVVKALPGEACRVTFHLPHRVYIKPGSHVYAFIPTVAWWMSHPFSVAWVDPATCVTPPSHPVAALKGTIDLNGTSRSPSPSRLEKQMMDDAPYETLHKHKTSISLIIAARSGMTRKLYNKAMACPNKTLRTFGFIEGPYYSDSCTMGSYGTAILFSGGAGITHHILHVRDLLIRADEGSVATQSIYLIWSVRSTESLNWVREWMDQIFRLPNRRQMLIIKLFISKPKTRHGIKSPSKTVQMFPGRCRPSAILKDALPKRIGATVVSVCGPGAFADEVRAATRENMARGMTVDFVEESFSW